MRSLVALFTRAWIEIPGLWILPHLEQVALFTRAWIEITCLHTACPVTVSPSSRGRGLKFTLPKPYIYTLGSPSSRGRGLKCPIQLRHFQRRNVALFTRAWIEIFSRLSALGSSPSSRGRGLKYDKDKDPTGEPKVALFTRAWIEILTRKVR